MFNQLFTCPRAVARHSTGPLLDERLRYLAYCAGRGSTKSSLRLIAQHLLVFTDYLPLEAGMQVSLEQIRAAANLWINREPTPQNVTNHYYGRMRFVSDARQWLTFLGDLHQRHRGCHRSQEAAGRVHTDIDQVLHHRIAVFLPLRRTPRVVRDGAGGGDHVTTAVRRRGAPERSVVDRSAVPTGEHGR